MADGAETPGLLARAYQALPNFTKLLANCVAATAFVVFALVMGFLIFEQVRYWTVGADADALAKRDFLCTKHKIDRPSANADALDLIAADISLLKEKARAFAQPSDPVGRIHSFIVCATVAGVSTSGVDLQTGGAETQLAGLPGAELIALEREEIAVIKGLFPEIPRRLIDKIESKLLAAQAIQREQQVQLAAVVEPTPPPPPSPLPDVAVAEPGPQLPPLTGSVAGTPDQGAGAEEPLPPTTGPSIWNVVSADVASWVVVVGADQNFTAAADQVAQTRRIVSKYADGSEFTGLFLIRNWKRTVIPFATREAAESMLQSAQKQLAYGGYVRSIADWCELAELQAVEPPPEVLKVAGEIPIYICSE